ncbi:copper resistance protein NlpE N-terminal domain-containing protein [Robiginitalea sp. SC105]|uniref:copper resistance protein NlpE N-terminal domain-containing protein n=1 Tax=Robiginitalea sp. SC105 TaxID=2762332 RepID=UPI00163A7B67|nr:copper resistance protein NlpE N-terminal domain-containing protein [Robiginitalea sp. SC105]MBC2838548.1 copper resistance protein NlpE N-terminal domain-containing protein [Robiginitalea sp. SC105]
MKKFLVLLVTACITGLAGCKPDPKTSNEQMGEKEISATPGPDTKPRDVEAAAALSADSTFSSQAADAAHNSRISVDWEGTYRGTLPCADCDAVDISITLFESGDFTRDRTYLGKSEELVTDSGTFAWDDSGSLITLTPEDGAAVQYQVGENVIFKLDTNGKRFSGTDAEKYMLQKNFNDPAIEDIKWQLVELRGQEINVQSNRIPGLTFHSSLGQVTGNNGCNVFVASYYLAPGNRVSFGQTAQSLKACPDREVADQLGQVLASADNYTLKDGLLSLNRARMAPLARFRPAD